MFRTALIVTLSLVVGASTLAAPLADPKYEVGISGMSCKGCEKEVKDLIGKLPSFKSVEVDLKAEKATIVVKEGASLTRADVEKILKGSKFAVTSFAEKKAESRPKH